MHRSSIIPLSYRKLQTVFDGGDQDSIEFSDLLQSSQFSSLSSSQNQFNSLPTNKNGSKHKHPLSSSLEGYLHNPTLSEDCEAPTMETAEKDQTETHSLSSDSSLSILSPSTSLQGYNQDSLGADNEGFEKDREEGYPESCSSSLKKDKSLFMTEYEKSATLEIHNVRPHGSNMKTDKQNALKKSFRGEKLYVTKPGERLKSWSVFCYWTLALALLTGAVIVAVLIGTGVIIVKRESQTIVEEYIKIPAHVSQQDDLKLQKQNLHSQTTVPNAFEGRLEIINMEWDPKLRDNTSEIYKILSKEFESKLKNLFEELSLNGEVIITVNEFAPGSVIVSYVAGWIPGNHIANATNIKNNIIRKLKEENGKLFGQFVISKESVELENVIKNCGKLGCENGCEYSYTELKLYCVFLEGQLSGKYNKSEDVGDIHKELMEHQSQNEGDKFLNMKDELPSEVIVHKDMNNNNSSTEATITNYINRKTVHQILTEQEPYINEMLTLKSETNKETSTVSAGLSSSFTQKMINERNLTTDRKMHELLTVRKHDFDIGMIDIETENNIKPFEKEYLYEVEDIPEQIVEIVHTSAPVSPEELLTSSDNSTKNENELQTQKLMHTTGSPFDVTSSDLKNIMPNINGNSDHNDEAFELEHKSSKEPVFDSVKHEEDPRKEIFALSEKISDRKGNNKNTNNNRRKIAEIKIEEPIKIPTTVYETTKEFPISDVDVQKEIGKQKEKEISYEGSGNTYLDEPDEDILITSGDGLLLSDEEVLGQNTYVDTSSNIDVDLEKEMFFIDKDVQFPNILPEDTKDDISNRIKAGTDSFTEDIEGSAHFPSTNLELSKTTTMPFNLKDTVEVPSSKTLKLINSSNEIINSSTEKNVYTVHLELPTFDDENDIFETSLLSVLNSSIGAYNLSISCHSNMFCDGRCLERHQICDSLPDCTNHLDEEDCHFQNCNPDEFPCLSGRCIPAGWKCDGKPDCKTAEDEVACTASCQPGEFLCREGKCIPELHFCDGVADCGQADDEVKCVCGPGEQKCLLGGGCVSNSQMCDGHFDCPDRSDEWNCLKITNKTVEIRSSLDGWHPICSDNWDDSWSNLVCSQLGYSGQKETRATVQRLVDRYSFWYKKSGVAMTPEPIQVFEDQIKEKECKSGAKIDVECQGFRCGKWDSTNITINSHEDMRDHQSGSQWPSLALLFHVKLKVSCTASIISPKWLATSHSCISSISVNPLEWVAFGGPDGFTPVMDETTQIKIVKDIIHHPHARHHQHLVNYDFALIELHEPFKFNSLVGAICLEQETSRESDLCVQAGWTSTSIGISFAQYLSYMPQSSACNSSMMYNGHMTDSMICYDSCHNDKGSPLMCQSESGVWQLHGVLSNPGLCEGSTEKPAVFTGIHAVREWIWSTVGSQLDQEL